MIIIKSPHFGEYEVSGANEQTAADWLKKNLPEATKAQEILLQRDAKIKFNVKVIPTNSHVTHADQMVV